MESIFSHYRTRVALTISAIILTLFGTGCGQNSLQQHIPRAQETYEVKSGDTLSRIGEGYGCPWQWIAQVNGIDDPTKLDIGDVLIIPAVNSPLEVIVSAETETPIDELNKYKHSTGKLYFNTSQGATFCTATHIGKGTVVTTRQYKLEDVDISFGHNDFGPFKAEFKEDLSKPYAIIDYTFSEGQYEEVPLASKVFLSELKTLDQAVAVSYQKNGINQIHTHRVRIIEYNPEKGLIFVAQNIDPAQEVSEIGIGGEGSGLFMDGKLIGIYDSTRQREIGNLKSLLERNYLLNIGDFTVAVYTAVQPPEKPTQKDWREWLTPN